MVTSGCSTSDRKFPNIYRWGIQTVPLKTYEGFDTLWVLRSSPKDTAKLKEKGNVLLAWFLPEGEGLTGKVDTLISSGFDGLYISETKIPTDDLITLINYARMSHPEFLVVVENVHEFKSYKNLMKEADGFVLKDHLLKEDGEEKLKELLRSKKKVMTLEFLKEKKAMEEYASLSKEKGLLPLNGHRPLKGRLTFADELFHLARPCD